MSFKIVFRMAIAFAVIFGMARYFTMNRNYTECTANYQELMFNFIEKYSNDTYIGENVKEIGDYFVSGDTDKMFETFNTIFVKLDNYNTCFFCIRTFGLRYFRVMEEIINLV